MIDAKTTSRAELVCNVVVPGVMRQRGLEPAISRCVVTETASGAIWLFVVLDVTRINRIEPYMSAELTHQISTVLRGKPVIISNTTGLRYAILMSARPSLSKDIEYPGWRSGILQIGRNYHGEVSVSWRELGHVLIAGITGSGKSNLLKTMVEQAVHEGFDLALADPDGRTFPHLAGSSRLISPITGTLDGCAQTIDAALKVMHDRAAAYNALPGVHDSIEAYNAAAPKPMKRLLVVADEFNGLVQATGGTKGALAQQMTQLAWGGRKFGIHLVLAGQTFEKDIVGPVRDQMTTRICFRVATPSIARIVLGENGAERLKTVGRAWSNRWGLIQAYRAPEPVEAPAPSDGLTIMERELATALRERHGGRATIKALTTEGLTRLQAAKLRADWLARGLVTQSKTDDNALILVEQNSAV